MTIFITAASHLCLKKKKLAAAAKSRRSCHQSWNFVTLLREVCVFREFLTGSVILPVRVPEEMALIFPTVDSGWPHETSFPAPPAPPRSPVVATLGRSKDANRQGHGVAASPPRSAEIATDVVVKF